MSFTNTIFFSYREDKLLFFPLLSAFNLWFNELESFSIYRHLLKITRKKVLQWTWPKIKVTHLYFTSNNSLNHDCLSLFILKYHLNIDQKKKVFIVHFWLFFFYLLCVRQRGFKASSQRAGNSTIQKSFLFQTRSFVTFKSS